MNTMPDLTFASHANAFRTPLSLEAVRQQAPAVFTPSAEVAVPTLEGERCGPVSHLERIEERDTVEV